LRGSVRTRSKVILVFPAVIFLTAAFLLAVALYYYSHPSAVQPLLEKALSRVTGNPVTIQEISYSLRPLRIHARGIRLGSLKGPGDFRLVVPELGADMRLEGPFGQRRLIVEALTVKGPALEVSQDTAFPSLPQESGGPTFLEKSFAFLFFRYIRLERLTVQEAQILVRSGDIRLSVEGIGGGLNQSRRLDMTGSVQMEWPSQDITLSSPHIQVVSDGAVSLRDPGTKLKMMVEQGSLQSPDMDLDHLEIKALLGYHPPNKELVLISSDIHSGPLAFDPPSGQKSSPVHIQAAGAMGLKTRLLKLSRLNVSMNDLLDLEGELRAVFGPEKKVEFKITHCRCFPFKILSLISGRTNHGLPGVDLEGALSLHGRLEGSTNQGKWDLGYDLKSQFQDNPFSVNTGPMPVRGRVKGHLSVRGDARAFKTSSLLTAEGTLFSIPGQEPYRLPHLEIHVPQGHVEIKKGSFDFPGIRITSSLLKDMQLSLKGDIRTQTVGLEGKDLHLLEAARTLDLLPEGWQSHGKSIVDLKARHHEEDGWTLNGSVGLEELRLQNQDQSLMGEKISLSVGVTGEKASKKSEIKGKASLNIRGGELLLDRFYMNFGTHPVTSAFSATYVLSSPSLGVSAFKVALKDIITLRGSGTLGYARGTQRVSLKAEVPACRLKPLYRHFLLDPFKAEHPLLASLDLGGDFSAELTVLGGAGTWTVKGHAGWVDGHMGSEETGFHLEGIHLDLPLWFSNNMDPEAGETLKGGLSIQSAQLPLLSNESVTFELEARPNTLALPSPLVLKVTGGEILAAPMTLKQPFSPERLLTTSLQVIIDRISPLLSGVWSYPIEGEMEGKLGPLHFDGHQIKTSGELEANVFGGRILFSDLRASGLFTSTPLYALSAQWEDIDLKLLTAGTSFGTIEGIMRGHVKDLEIAFGQPQRFDLFLETVRKRGVPQRISVKAVDNIARIGGGQSPFMGAAGLLSALFKTFSYQKIGIRASLANDVFRINGTIKEGGKEYLVKRNSFSGVNVVNQNPDNRIRFKDMVKRIKRVTAGNAEPVIR